MLKLLLGNPWVFGGIAALILALTAWGITEDRLRAAAEKGEKAAELQVTTYADAAANLAKTHADDITNMNVCKSVLADQSDAIAHLQFSLTATNDSAAKYAAQSDADLRTLSDRIAEQQAFIDKNPDRVCRLTPEMRQRAESRVWK